MKMCSRRRQKENIPVQNCSASFIRRIGIVFPPYMKGQSNHSILNHGKLLRLRNIKRPDKDVLWMPNHKEQEWSSHSKIQGSAQWEKLTSDCLKHKEDLYSPNMLHSRLTCDLTNSG